MKMFLNVKETIDPYLTKRGDIGEQIAVDYLKKKGYNNVVRYDTKEQGYDMFKHLTDVGGVLDIEEKDLNYVFEVKSKSYEDYYNKFKNENFRFKQEEEQAKFYKVLRGNEKAFMIYVFFKEEAKEAILANKPIKLEWFEVEMYELEVDKDEIEMQTDYAIFYRDSCYETKSIPLEDISQKMFEYLKTNYGV